MRKIVTNVCGAYMSNSYLVDDTLLIDSGDDIGALERYGNDLKAVLLTHGHFDHMLACGELQKRFNVPVYIDKNDMSMAQDASLAAYDRSVCMLPFPDGLDCTVLPDELFGFRVIRTPGHSQGSVCYYDEKDGLLFSGDTMFRAGFGRTDLFGGSAFQMRKSLFTLFELPDDTVVYPGHGSSTTIGEEKKRYHR